MTQDRKRSRVSITDDTRKAIRNHYASCNPKPTQRAIMKWFEDNFQQRLSQSTISDILSHKFSYLDNTTGGPSKRHRRSLHPVLDQALSDWYQIARAHNAEITGEIIKHTAVKLWENLPEYKGIPCPELDGWINSFKKRHNIFLRRWVYSHRDANQPSSSQFDPSLTSMTDVSHGQPNDNTNMTDLHVVAKLSHKEPNETNVNTDDGGNEPEQHVTALIDDESPPPSSSSATGYTELPHNKSRSVRRWIQHSGDGQVTAIASEDQDFSPTELAPPATDVQYQQQQQQQPSIGSRSNFTLQQNIADAALRLTLARYVNHKSGMNAPNTMPSPIHGETPSESDIMSEEGTTTERPITFDQAHEAVNTLIRFEQEHKNSPDGQHPQINDLLRVCKEWIDYLQGENTQAAQPPPRQVENSS